MKVFKKDLQKRIFFSKTEKKKLLLKCLLQNLTIFSHYSLFLKLFLLKYGLKRKVFNTRGSSRIVNRCNFTNRSRISSKKFGSSRFVLRNLMQFGLLPGYKKSVW